jgi:hypothetical protein
MTVVDEMRAWMAQERDRARAKLLGEGMHPATVEMLLSEAEQMHGAQAECAARMLGEAPAVVMH